MKHLLKSCVLLTLVFCVAACAKYQTQFEGPYSDDPNGSTAPAIVYEIVFCQNGQLYLCDQKLKNVKQLPTVGSVQKASINYNHTKIAYQSAGQNLRIIDLEGNDLGSVPGSGNLKCFDWHANHETLYMLDIDNNISQFGPSIPLSTSNALSALPYFAWSYTLNTIAVGPLGDVYIGFEVYDGLYFTRGVYVNKVNGQDVFLNSSYLVPSGMRLSADGETLLVNGVESNFYPYSYLSYGLGSFNSLSIFRNAALSPNGNEVIGWYDSDTAIRSYQNSFNFLNVQDTYGLTDIDW